MTIKHYSKRYEIITNGNLPDYRKKIMLAGLMRDMEANLAIPLFKNPEWEEENPEIAALYDKVSASRNG